MLLDKKNALFVKCCIIANGVTDSQGDTLYAEDIKKIFTSFNNQDNFEIYHNDIPIQEVSLLENYICPVDETLGTSIVPKGSWMAVVRVDNPEIQEGLLTGEFGGVSLNNRIAPRCKGNLTGTVRYKDVADAECVIPLLISFVKGGANGYGLHVMDYDAYIKKSKDIEFEENNGGRKMDFKEFINGLKSLIKEAEDTPEEEAPAIEKEDEETKEEEPVETPTEEEEVVVEEETEEEKEEEPVVEKEDETAEPEVEEEEETTEETEAEEEDEAEIIKEDEDADAEFEAKVAAVVEKILAEKFGKEDESEEEESEETTEEETEVADEDTPKITKSEKVVIDTTEPVKHINYYDMSGRDPLTGKKLRK